MESPLQMIPEENLPYLKDYNFHAVSPTPLDVLLASIWWTPVADMLPKWLSPNVITLMGAFCIFVINYCLFVFIPDLESYQTPSWIPIVISLMLFLYMTFDGLDGKQARKLGISSPLGQLMDHGVDAVVSVFYGYMAFTFAPGGFSFPVMLTIGVAPLHVLGTIWRESEFSTFSYVNGVMGVTETNLASILLQLVSYFFKPKYYNRIIYRFSPAVLATFVGRITPGYIDINTAAVYFIAIIATIDWLGGILRLYGETGKRWECMSFMLAAAVTVYPAAVLAYTLPPHLKVVGCLFASTTGAIICVNNIVCLLCKSKLRRFHFGLLPQYACLVQYFMVPFLSRMGYNVSNFKLTPQEFDHFLRAVTVYAFAYIVFVFVKTSMEICSYLDITFWTVPKKNKKL